MRSVLAVQDYGDAALLVEVIDDDAERRWARAQALGTALRQSSIVTDVVASYRHVFIAYDPVVVDSAVVRTLIDEAAELPATVQTPRLFTVPVVYGGDSGPDLETVALLWGMATADVVDLHTGTDWLIRFVGSPMGAPFLEGPPLPTSVPRLAEPRTKVPTGSVALSGFQSMIYNAPSPGGWQLIGRTPLRPFDIDAAEHLPYRAGDRIRFQAVDT